MPHSFHQTELGWVCIQCETMFYAPQPERPRQSDQHSTDEPVSDSFIAKWADLARRSLTCPKCGITELVEIS